MVDPSVDPSDLRADTTVARAERRFEKVQKKWLAERAAGAAAAAAEEGHDESKHAELESEVRHRAAAAMARAPKPEPALSRERRLLHATSLG